MRWIPIVLLTLALSACEGMPWEEQKTASAVDTTTLAPLSSREQSLIFAADGAYQQGNFASAERDYMAAVADSKGRIDAHLALAKLYEKQMQPDKERVILERALVLQPNHPLANYLMGRLQLNANQYTSALEYFKRGRQSRPQDVDLTVGQAVSLDMLGRHREAQQLYTGLLQANPGPASTLPRTNLAMSYILSEQPQRAIDLLEAEANKPGATNVTRHNLALAYGLVGRQGDAKTLLNGDIDEETRLLAVARMRSYYNDPAPQNESAAPAGNITPMPAAPEPELKGPAPVVKYPPTATKPAPAKEPAAAAAPVKATKPVAEKTPAVVAAPPVPQAQAAPAAAAAEEPYDLKSDPNYIPGLEEMADKNE